MGGMFDKPAAMPGPPAWVFYVRVGDLERALAAVKSGGGQVLNGPTEVPGGDTIVNCMDPQGALFSLHQKGS
jgi:predicted enzyme related to lactoylglutathione lyase